MTAISRRASAIAVSLCLLFGLTGHTAEAADEKAQFFADLFIRTCVQHVNALEGLRADLDRNKTPSLPQAKAATYLAGHTGRAWPIPSDIGEFVLSLSDGGVCTLHGRRADAAEVEKLFTAMVSQSPAGKAITVTKTRDESRKTKGGTRHSLEYRWTAPNNARRVLQFILTTSTSETASIQALASAAAIASE